MEMRRGVAVYIIIGALIVIAFLLLYPISVEFTGLVVFQQGSEGDFNEGNYINTNYNGSAIVLNSGQTSGTYTSKIFDANTSLQWNTLTWQGGVPDSTDNSVTNESGWINSTGYTFSGFDSSWSEITLTALYDATDNSPIGLGNATVNSLSGVVTNATTDEWDNVLISYDYVSPFNASLSFQVRSCSTIDCSSVSFLDNVDLNNINLIGQYFQYQVSFSSSDSSLTPFLENVVVNSSLGIVSLNISEPRGTKSSQTGVPIKLTSIGLNLACFYNVQDSNGVSVIENTTLPNCGASSFNVLDDGSYTFNLYMNNSLGVSVSASSTFLVDTPAPSSGSEESQVESPVESPITGQVTKEIVQLTLSEVQDLVLNPNDTEQLSLSTKNTGTVPLNTCALTSLGDFASWISFSIEEQNLNPGDEIVYGFDLTIPENQELGQYTLTLELRCDKFVQKEDFVVDVVKKNLEFELISARRVRIDRVQVIYSLEELSGSEQSVELRFSILDINNQEIASASVNESIDADASEEFSINININESLLPINATTNETLETELTLNINLNSQIYSSTVTEKITIGAPLGGFAIFGEGGLISTGNILILVVFVLVLGGVFFVVRRLRTKGLHSFSKLLKKDSD